MDLRQLRYFTETVHAGSISAAAKRCAISQPSLSQQIMALEDEIGEQLMERRPRGIKLTTAGELLLRHAKRLLAEEAQMLEQFKARGELQSGRVLFGIIPTLAPYLLPPLLGGYRKEFPAVEFEIMEDRTSVLVREIVAGTIEFAILSDVVERDRDKYALQIKEIFREPLVLAVASTHQLALQKSAPSVIDLVPHELIHLKEGHCLRDQTLKACGVKECDSTLQCDQLETAIAMVSANLGIAIVPKLAIPQHGIPNVTFRPFRKPTPTRSIYMLKRKGTRLSKAANQLVASLTTYIPSGSMSHER